MCIYQRASFTHNVLFSVVTLGSRLMLLAAFAKYPLLHINATLSHLHSWVGT
jgi:hypothetical protein